MGVVIITLFTIVLPAAPASSTFPDTCHVSEVLRVFWPDYFECRLSNYAPSQVVRFRVYWKDISADPADITAKRFITELFASANHIELYDVQLRNYFRVNAHIRIDGRPLADILTAQNLLPPQQDQIKTIEKPLTAQGYPTQGQTRRLQYPVSQPSSAVVSEQPRVASIRGALEAVVDCSILTEETSFAEALDILSTSVNPPMPLVVLWSDLKANAYIDKDTPIGVSGMGRMKAAQALKIILRSVSLSGPKLAVVAEGGILTLGTQQTLGKNKTTQVYSIEDLLSVPSLVNELFGTGSVNQQGGFRRQGLR